MNGHNALPTVRRLLLTSVLTVATAGMIAGCSGDQTASSASSTEVDTTSAPTALQWEMYRGVNLPKSVQSGPSQFDIVPHGYEKSPQGAVLAAVRGQAYLALTPDSQWGQVVSVITAPGPGRDEFAANRALVSITGDVPADRAPVFVAFKVAAYDGEAGTAVVEVVQRLREELFSYPVALEWIGDWRIVLPTSEENVDARQITSLDDYTPLEAAA